VDWSHNQVTFLAPAVWTEYTVPVRIVQAGQLSNSLDLVYIPTEDQPATLAFEEGTSSSRTYDFGAVELTIELQDVTTTGTVTVSIERGSAAPTGLDPDRFIGLRWVIESDGNISFVNATLVFHYDEAALNGIDPTTLTVVIRDAAGVLTEYQGIVDTVARTVTVSNIPGFSTWYVGAPAATHVPDWMILH